MSADRCKRASYTWTLRGCGKGLRNWTGELALTCAVGDRRSSVLISALSVNSQIPFQRHPECKQEAWATPQTPASKVQKPHISRSANLQKQEKGMSGAKTMPLRTSTQNVSQTSHNNAMSLSMIASMKNFVQVARSGTSVRVSGNCTV